MAQTKLGSFVEAWANIAVGFGITAVQGGSYLASYGSDRGKMWQRFLFTLEEAHLRQARAEVIAAAAVATFSAARYYLTEAEPVGVVSAARACAMMA